MCQPIIYRHMEVTSGKVILTEIRAELGVINNEHRYKNRLKPCPQNPSFSSVIFCVRKNIYGRLALFNSKASQNKLFKITRNKVSRI